VPGRAIAIETAATNVTCNALCPGVLPTPAIKSKIAATAARDGLSANDVTNDYLTARQPSGRFIAAESVGAMAVLLCGPAGQDVTGAALPIDGGWAIA
jgi:3-hydroxybutyrate dehydrogenase